MPLTPSPSHPTAAVHILAGPLGDPVRWDTMAGAGAVLCFEGIARPLEGGRAITALDYEAYQPMTQRMLERLAEVVLGEHGLIALCVEHSTGRVAVGQCSFRLRIASRHRKEGLAAMDAFIDRMKRDVPLWKHPVFAA